MEVLRWIGSQLMKLVNITKDIDTPFGISLWDMRLGFAIVAILLAFFLRLTSTLTVKGAVGHLKEGDRIKRRNERIRSRQKA